MELPSCLIFLCHTMSSREAENITAFVHFAYFFTVIVRKQEFAFDIKQRISQPFVIIHIETCCIKVFGINIRRITVEQRIRSVVVFNKRFKILILYNYIFKSFADLLYEVEKTVN